MKNLKTLLISLQKGEYPDYDGFEGIFEEVDYNRRNPQQTRTSELGKFSHS